MTYEVFHRRDTHLWYWIVYRQGRAPSVEAVGVAISTANTQSAAIDAAEKWIADY